MLRVLLFIFAMTGCSTPQTARNDDQHIRSEDAKPRTRSKHNAGAERTTVVKNAAEPAKSVARPADDAGYEEFLRWAVANESYPPVSTAGCSAPALRLIEPKSRRYHVRCERSEFEMSAQCPDDSWSRCLRTIEAWRIHDDRLEAMRKLAQGRKLGIGPDAPHCGGALATPAAPGKALFDLNCSDGYAQLEVVCPGEPVDETCRVFTRNQERLPYGLPTK